MQTPLFTALTLVVWRQPCALVFAPDGKRLYVCNSTQNAIAVCCVNMNYAMKTRRSFR
jgi:hypothetical protein